MGKDSLLRKLKIGTVAAVTSLASLVTGCNPAQTSPDYEALQLLRNRPKAVAEKEVVKKEEKKVEEKQENKEKEGIDIYAETTFVSNYVFGSGLIIGKKDPKHHGGVNKNFISLTKGNLTGYLFTSFDFQDAEHGNGLHEVDLGVDYFIPLTKYLSATAGYGSWIYPTRLLGEHGDHVFMGKINYKGPIDIEGSLIHLIEHEDVGNGELYSIKFSKEFPLGKIFEREVSAIPSFSTGTQHNLYGRYGTSTFTPGLDFKVSDKKGNPFCNLFLRFQDGKSGSDDLFYFGVTFPVFIKHK